MPLADGEHAARADVEVALDVGRERGDDGARPGADQGLVDGQEVRPGGRPLGRLGDQAEEPPDHERGAVGEVDVLADVEQVQVAADDDPRPAVEVDAVEHVERVQVAAGLDRGARQEGVERRSGRPAGVPRTISGPERLAVWKPRIAEIRPLLTVIWPMLRMCDWFVWP